MPDYRYRVVDVFTDRPLEGNPLAVFPEADTLDATTMQRIARELNLAETVFVVAPTRAGCVARARIFTPAREMVFAGHPTLGTAWVLLDEGRLPAGATSLALDEQVGAVPVRVDGPLLWLETPPIVFGPVFPAEAAAAAVNLAPADLLPVAPQLVTAGNPTIFIAVRDRETVDRATADLARLVALRGTLGPLCLFVFTPADGGAFARMFAPEYGVAEDPATGSSTGPIAAFMMRYGLAPAASGTRLVSEQGVAMGRRSLLHVMVRGEHGADGIDVGGSVVPVIRGTLTLP